MEHLITNHRHYRDFTIIPNELLQREDLSFFSRGLLCYLLSLPDDWRINVSVISDKFQESERKILVSLKELIELGYCKRDPRRIDGKLAGQHYFITDIPFDFSDPSKNEGAAKQQNSRPAEIPAPQKNEGAEKEYSLFDKEDIEINKEKSKNTRERFCLFENSKFFDIDAFKAALQDEAEAGIDVEYYYYAVKDWSASKGAKKYDWIATARNFMRGDTDTKRLHTIQDDDNANMIQYLKDMAEL